MMENPDQIKLFPPGTKKSVHIEKKHATRKEALDEARVRLKKAEEELAAFMDGSNNSYMGSGERQKALEEEVAMWEARIRGLES